jgi:F-type H+-transporting ATPase subunit epsilon
MADEHAFGAELLLPESALFSGAATSVVLRTSEGDLTILDGHTALVGDVAPVVVRIEAEGSTESYCVHGGFLQVRTERGAATGLLDGVDETVRSTRVTVLAGVAEPVGEIDVARAQAARDAASATLASLPEEGDDEVLAARAHAEGALARATLRLEAAGAAIAQ